MIPDFDIGITVKSNRYLETRGLVIASSGGGKSWLLRCMNERIAPTGVQQIVIDDEGDFYTLREKFNFALVGPDGEIPLSVAHAEFLAEKIYETHLSVIIDVSELDESDKCRFVGKFINRLMNMDKALYHPCYVFLDEADVFCPQDGETESSKPVKMLCSKGRKRGLCPILATQRVAKLHKSATADLLNKFIGVIGQDIDRKRAADELGLSRREDVRQLAQLPNGVFYATGPAVGYELRKFKVAPVQTTHPDSGTARPAIPPTPGAIRKILRQLGDIPTEAEKELKTIQDYQARIHHLETQLQAAGKPTAAPGPSDRERVLEQTVASQNLYIVEVQEYMSNLQPIILKLKELATPVLQSVAALEAWKGLKIEPVPQEPPTPVCSPDRPKQALPVPVSIKTGEGPELGGGPMRMLYGMATGDYAKNKTRLSFISGYSLTSGTFDEYLRQLRKADYVKVDGDRLMLTSAGQRAAENNVLDVTPQAVIMYWLQKLSSGPAKMLKVITDHWPGTVTKEQLSKLSGYSLTSGTFEEYVRQLKQKQFITITDKKELQASQYLYRD